MSVQLEVVTPIGPVLKVSAEAVIAPGALGEFSVLTDHRPALIRLRGGALRYEGAQAGVLFIRGGIAEVRPDGILVLAEEAVTPQRVDVDAARRILKDADREIAEEVFLTDERVERIASDRAYAEAMLNKP
ncbi:ATP synthase F1 subunit epsilon [Myxococcota bacterium]|nr:ATP synthase F1 subunit epsilon [Myxococcota bacterium]MBU1431514.1 ATP synthase F1 subunit epsilon [Myxococcota bacterium]MBU1898167.1 ATP synthase F1 subunit epsilon [Myxococcota bacterium]